MLAIQVIQVYSGLLSNTRITGIFSLLQVRPLATVVPKNVIKLKNANEGGTRYGGFQEGLLPKQERACGLSRPGSGFETCEMNPMTRLVSVLGAFPGALHV